MFDLFSDRLEKKRKEAHEAALKKALSEKFFNYDETKSEKTVTNSDGTNYTVITIAGNKLRVLKESITILDVSPERLAMNH